jgi:hypothetical protein
MIPLIKCSELNDIYLHKLAASNKIFSAISEAEKAKARSKIRTASSGDQQYELVNAFIKILAQLNLRIFDKEAESVINNLSKSGSPAIESSPEVKQASISKKGDRKDELKIVSKNLRDSHYQVDVSKDLINRDGKKVYMVSCYARDAYLGRYLIKRNFFFTPDRETSADDAYDEIMKKVASIKERYYSEVIGVAEIFAQFKKSLDGVISEVRFEEDELPTNVNR